MPERPDLDYVVPILDRELGILDHLKAEDEVLRGERSAVVPHVSDVPRVIGSSSLRGDPWQKRVGPSSSISMTA